MDKYTALAQKLKNREKIIGTTMIIFKNPIILEQMNRPELDFVLFDAEHDKSKKIQKNNQADTNFDLCLLFQYKKHYET